MVRRASLRKLASMPDVTNALDRLVSGSAQEIWPPAPLCPIGAENGSVSEFVMLADGRRWLRSYNVTY